MWRNVTRRVFVERLEDSRLRLYITRIEEGDEGQYTCETDANEITLSARNYLQLYGQSHKSVFSTIEDYIGCCFFSVRLQISRRRWHRSVWNFAWRYISIPDRFAPLLGTVPQGNAQIRNFGPKFWPFDRENCKSQRYISIRA